jgi:phage baseplate assembly protein V
MARTKNLLGDTDYNRQPDARYKNTITIARVSKIESDKTMANVRVLFPDRTDHEGTQLVSKPVPVMQQSAGHKRSYAMPRVGQNCVMARLANSTSDYVMLGTFYTTSDPPPVEDPKLDYVIYDDGSIQQFNAETGTLDWKLKGDMNFENEGGMSTKLKKGYTLEIEGDVLIKAPNIKLEGAMEFKGDIDHTGNMTTHGHHTDDAGTHQNAMRESELLARIQKLEAHMAATEERLAKLEAKVV